MQMLCRCADMQRCRYRGVCAEVQIVCRCKDVQQRYAEVQSCRYADVLSRCGEVQWRVEVILQVVIVQVGSKCKGCAEVVQNREQVQRWCKGGAG